ncbi:Hypothetical protein FKW44_004718, partial [Caligus rogercresseyi]
KDKLLSNLNAFKKANGDSKALWNLANRAMGKTKATPLPRHLLSMVSAPATTKRRRMQ